MISIARTIPLAISDCKSIGPDILLLEAWASGIPTNPADLKAFVTKNVLRHSIGLTRNLKAATTAWNNSEFFSFGEILGESIVIATS